MAAAAALAFAVPFAFARPAHAAVYEDVKQVSLTFVTYSGATVTCTLFGQNIHYTDSQAAVGDQRSFRSDGPVVPECKGGHHMAVAYKDQEGDENSFSTSAVDTNQLSLRVEGVRGDVRIFHSVSFTQCDPSQSAACFLTVQTSTK